MMPADDSAGPYPYGVRAGRPAMRHMDIGTSKMKMIEFVSAIYRRPLACYLSTYAEISSCPLARYSGDGDEMTARCPDNSPSLIDERFVMSNGL